MHIVMKQQCGTVDLWHRGTSCTRLFEILRLVCGFDLLLVLLYLGFVDNKKTIEYHSTGALRDVEWHETKQKLTVAPVRVTDLLASVRWSIHPHHPLCIIICGREIFAQLMCYAWLWCSLSRVFIQRWSTVALPGSCSLVRNSELWQGLRWPNRLKLELSTAMQSNKSSKERDGAEKDKQIAFYKTVFPAIVFLARDGERRRGKERGKERHRHRQAEGDSVHEH